MTEQTTIVSRNTGRRMGNDAIARTGVIGIEAAGNTIAHGVLDSSPGETADTGHGRKGTADDQLQRRRHLRQMLDEDGQAAEDIEQGHNGHDPFHNGRNAPQAAEDGDETGESQKRG